MASGGMMAGMQGVFLVTAELSRRGFIVSTTSRNALGADLLVTDQGCQHAWSVQVKTNNRRANFWLTGKKALTLRSPSHICVFVNLHKTKAPQFLVVPSDEVATEQGSVSRQLEASGLSFRIPFHRMVLATLMAGRLLENLMDNVACLGGRAPVAALVRWHLSA